MSAVASMWPPEGGAASLRNLQSICPALVSAGFGKCPGDLIVAAGELISVFESNYDKALALQAAVIVAQLAQMEPAVVDLLVHSASRYVRWLSIDDSFPYHPNAFDALAMSGLSGYMSGGSLRQGW